MNITEFLEARIAEDEAQLAATPRAAQQTDDFDYGGTDDYLRFTIGYGRAVAECAAKRAIVALADNDLRVEVQRRDASALGAALMHHDALCALAAVYKDHPDYREDWSSAT